MRSWCLAICVFLTTASAAAAAPQADDLALLTAGVRELTSPGVPGPLAVFGEQAFAVAAANDHALARAVVAAARHGKGRVVAFGHGGFLGTQSLRIADTGTLARNALRWLGAGKTVPRVAQREARDLLAHWAASGEKFTETACDLAHLDADLLVLPNPDRLAPDEIERVQDFVAAGGGLLVTGLAWGWLQLHPGQELVRDHRGNALLRPMGLAFADGHADRPRVPACDPKVLAKLHAGAALAALAAQPQGPDSSQQVDAVLLGVRTLPTEDAGLVARARRLCGDAGAIAIGPGKPLAQHSGKARLAVALAHELASRQLAEVAADPSAPLFPGAVPADAPRLRRQIVLDLGRPGWAGTGLYAAPGESLSVRGQDLAGLALRIGCHTDQNWHHGTWNRHPAIARRFALRAGEQRVASPFGGLVYVEVPAGRQGRIEIDIAGAVAAPRFVRGKTALAEWELTLRAAPAPWAELEADRVILTVPAQHVRDVRDPRPLLEFWDQVLGYYAELGQRPLADRPQRFVADAQISAGYMHSGYPIMTHLDVAGRLVDVALLRSRPGEGWGFWHELGHNHQQGAWTFEGTGEVTCNLFSLYVIQQISGQKPLADPRLKNLAKKVRDHLQNGAPFARWQQDPFLALFMYGQLQDAFGWETFQKVFAEYRDLPAANLPKSDAEKRDQWLVRFSRAAGRNLGPFFQRWGVPVSADALAAVASLPAWMPEEKQP